MRKSIGLLTLAGLAALAAAHLGPTALGDYAKALQEAKTLKANYTVLTIGGASERFSIALKKPNMLRVETPTQVIVSDGKDLTTLDKADGVYYKQSASDATVAEALSPEALNVWAGFFNPKALTAMSSKSLGTKSRAGMTLDAVEATYDSKGERVLTYFLDTKDKVARQVQIDLNAPAGKTTKILNAKDLEVDATLSDDTFAFKAPAGTRETTLAEMSAARWLTDLDEAKALAAKTGKRIFVDFMASWCGPCKLLDAQVLQTDRFKELAKKKFVLLRIDVDEDKSTATTYKIEAMPTQMVLDKNGMVLAQTVGYRDPQTFYDFLLPAAG